MSRTALVNWLIVLAVVVLAAVPLVFIGSSTGFGGADNAAAELIEQDHPGFEPWATPLWEPAPETASALFALQAAIGAGFLGYFFGAARTRRRLLAQFRPDPAPAQFRPDPAPAQFRPDPAPAQFRPDPAPAQERADPADPAAPPVRGEDAR